MGIIDTLGDYAGYQYHSDDPTQPSIDSFQSRWAAVVPTGALTFKFANVATSALTSTALLSTVGTSFGVAGAPRCVIRIPMAEGTITMRSIADGLHNTLFVDPVQNDGIGDIIGNKLDAFNPIARMGWEFDGTWYEWPTTNKGSAALNAQPATDYKAA